MTPTLIFRPKASQPASSPCSLRNESPSWRVAVWLIAFHLLLRCHLESSTSTQICWLLFHTHFPCSAFSETQEQELCTGHGLPSTKNEEIVWHEILKEFSREWNISPVAKKRSVAARRSSGWIVVRTKFIGGGCSFFWIRGETLPTESKTVVSSFRKILYTRRCLRLLTPL